MCIFCGRALCKDCVREMPHIVALYRDERNIHRAIVTARALYCGICEPREDPIELPELK
jgi:NAD-dependent dihydropyrimidine dehydrogenase PreA subunit